MTTRNLSKKFETLRLQFNKASASPRVDWNDNSHDGNASLLGSRHDQEAGVAQLHSTLVSTLPPKWVDLVEEVHEDFAKARETIATLQEFHNRRLQVTFNADERSQEQEIDMTTRTATDYIKAAEIKIKRIAVASSEEGGSLTEEERVLRINVMRNLGSDLQALSKQFRHIQKDFIMKLKGQAQIGSEFFADESKSSGSASASSTSAFEEGLDKGFTEEQMAAMEEMEQRADEREREIIHLAQSVNELATLFNELSLLVVEQGTILDRIDYNVASALDQVQQGNVHLHKADDYSKRTLTLKCILVLVVIIIIEIIILVSKKSSSSS